ncbi:hypothetical protein B4135_0977 [Caldibacillus debilis]|uniref:Uncharacterized protein n=1 Tax=Caldibacillus debilis TaxID=301148 RepID=A0A150MF16_9BACI|nr:hypothetical protein B4135_0977 [Caldibacillus debilis]
MFFQKNFLFSFIRQKFCRILNIMIVNLLLKNKKGVNRYEI